jgi:hypothetical protein
MQSGLLAAEMGFLLDVDKDGVPDWASMVPLPKQAGRGAL